jgi:hypothetical protein
MKKLLLLTLLLVLAPAVMATAANYTHGVSLGSSTGDTNPAGVNITSNLSCNITHIYIQSGDGATGCRVYNANTSNWVSGMNGTVAGTTCTPSDANGWEYLTGNIYYLMAYGGTTKYAGSGGSHDTGAGTFYTTGAYCNANPCVNFYADGNYRHITGFECNTPGSTPSPNSSSMTLYEAVNGSTVITSAVIFVAYDNVTSSEVYITLLPGSNPYFMNSSLPNGNYDFRFVYGGSRSGYSFWAYDIPFVLGTDYNFNTSQAKITVSVKVLFTNATISIFNITNGLAKNVSGGFLPANVGSNNIKVDVPGNTSKNYSITATNDEIVQYNATGIYDSTMTIIAKNTSNAAINNFTITYNVTGYLSDTLYNTTTNGSLVIPIVRNLIYGLTINNTGYSDTYKTVTPLNASNNYTFTFLTLNTFEITVYNETTNTRILTTNTTLQVISDVFAANYTFSNGSFNISFLTPSSYILRYFIGTNDTDNIRDYYVTLNPYSYNYIRLYAVDSDISNIYNAIIQDQATARVSGAIVSLLRYYVENNSYHTVEMTETDTNGNAVFRVVPNVIPYKFSILSDGQTFFTTPTKLISSSNTYTINLEENPLTSYTAMQGVYRNLSFNNATLTYTFVWSDPNNIVSSACLSVEQQTIRGNNLISNTCSNGMTGSLIYTITDTNNTRYRAIGIINTNTQYSTYNTGWVSADFIVNGIASFGLVGILIMLILSMTFIFVGIESGIDTMILASTIGILGCAAFGIAIGNWAVIFPIIVLTIIIVYKSRT